MTTKFEALMAKVKASRQETQDFLRRLDEHRMQTGRTILSPSPMLPPAPDTPENREAIRKILSRNAPLLGPIQTSLLGSSPSKSAEASTSPMKAGDHTSS